MVVGKGRLLTDGLNRQRPKSKFLSVTHSLMSVYSEANRTPNHALQRTAAVCHAGCLRSRRASPPPSLSLGSLGALHVFPDKQTNKPRQHTKKYTYVITANPTFPL